MASGTASWVVSIRGASPHTRAVTTWREECKRERCFGLPVETPVDRAWELGCIGANPQMLVENIVRSGIYRSSYWRERCFGLTAETLIGKAVELDHVGGTFGHNGPTPFLCLALKMLQMQPDRETVVGFISNEEHRYLRALGAFYLCLTGTGADVRRYLEPLSNDHREIRERISDEEFTLTDVGCFIDELLTQDSCCDNALPRS